MLRTRRAGLLVSTLLLGCVLAGCASSNGGKPDWRPQAASTLEPGNGPNVTPGIGEPGAGGSSAGGTPSGGGSAGSPGATSSPAADPAVVATGLSAPTGIAVLPDLSALVAERTTGRILHVQATAGQPVVVVRTLTGIDATGDGGLLDIALSPTYQQDGLVYAYLTTATDNEVVDFTLTGPVTPVLTGIPKGATDNLGRIAFDGNGDLLIGTGDAGQPALAADPASLAGKILQVNGVGQPVTGTSPVISTGHQSTAGLCIDPNSGTVLQVERRGGGTADELNVIVAGKDYGWPTPTATSVASAVTFASPDLDLGGCTVTGGAVYLTSLYDTALLSIPLTVSGSTITFGQKVESLKGTYGRLLSVVGAPDGSLWLTTSNKDGNGKPVAADERVLHIPPPSGSGGSSKA